MRTGRPQLPIGALGEVGVTEQIQDGKLSSGNLRWRTATEADVGGRRRWQAVAGYRDRAGKKRKIRRYSEKSQAEARRLLKLAWADEAKRKRLDRPGASSTVRLLCEKWWEDFKDDSKVRDQTKDQYKDTLDRLIIPTFGDLRVYELDTARICAGLEEVGAEVTSRARMSRVVLKHVCSFAVRTGALEVNPVTSDVPTFKTSGKAPDSLTASNYKDVRQAIIAWQTEAHFGPARSTVVLDVLDFMVATGCRTGEALALRWEDVHLGKAPSVTFAGTLIEPRKNRTLHRQDFPKTEAGFRTVPIGPLTEALLIRRAGEEGANEANVVFPNARGGLLSPSGFRLKLRQALKAADLERFYPYLARKTAARTIRDSDSIEAASATLGHSSTAVTVKHYAGAVHDAPDVSTALEGFLRGSL